MDAGAPDLPVTAAPMSSLLPTGALAPAAGTVPKLPSLGVAAVPATSTVATSTGTQG
jgi:hypothetical protein